MYLLWNGLCTDIRDRECMVYGDGGCSGNSGGRCKLNLEIFVCKKNLLEIELENDDSCSE